MSSVTSVEELSKENYPHPGYLNLDLVLETGQKVCVTNWGHGVPS